MIFFNKRTQLLVQLIGLNTGFPKQSFMTFLDKNVQLNDTHQ